MGTDDRHRGVLIHLDELPEFHPRVLEVLRQPVEDGVVTIARARETLTFPARFTLVAARNPCPCGFYGDATRPCTCAEGTVTRYQKRLSGPILDRIDMHIEVPAVPYKELRTKADGNSSAQIRDRVEAARETQRQRGFYNSQIPPSQLRTLCVLDDSGERTRRGTET